MDISFWLNLEGISTSSCNVMPEAVLNISPLITITQHFEKMAAFLIMYQKASVHSFKHFHLHIESIPYSEIYNWNVNFLPLDKGEAW
jgi:hypothetical protein